MERAVQMSFVKKLPAVLLCVLAAASLAACGSRDAAAPSGSAALGQLANPFTDYKTLAEAEKASGISISAPVSIAGGFSGSAYRAMGTDMIEVIYSDGTEENEIRIRKAPGTDDISGDYNDYPETDTLSADGLTVTVRGSKGIVHVAVWTNGDDTFAIDASGAGLSRDAAVSLARSVR